MNLLSSGATLRFSGGLEPSIFVYRDPAAALDSPSQDGLINGEVELVLKRAAEPVLSIHFTVEAKLKLPDGPSAARLPLIEQARPRRASSMSGRS